MPKEGEGGRQGKGDCREAWPRVKSACKRLWEGRREGEEDRMRRGGWHIKENREEAYTLKRLPYESLRRLAKAVAREKDATDVHHVQVREAAF